MEIELLLSDLPKPLLPHLSEINLFGSCAGGDYKWDIDLAIITKGR